MKTITLDVKELDQEIFTALVSQLNAGDDRDKLKIAMEVTDKIMVKFNALADKQAKRAAAQQGAGIPLATGDAPLAQALPRARTKRPTKKERLAAAIAANAAAAGVQPVAAAPAPAPAPAQHAAPNPPVLPIPPFGAPSVAPFGSAPEPERI